MCPGKASLPQLCLAATGVCGVWGGGGGGGGLATCTHAALRTGTSVWVTPKVGSRVFRVTRRLARQSLRAGAQGQWSCGWMQIESRCALGPASCVNNDAMELMIGCVCAVRTSREEYARQRCLRNVGMTATRPIGRRAMMNVSVFSCGRGGHAQMVEWCCATCCARR